jgi:hypothetical protein
MPFKDVPQNTTTYAHKVTASGVTYYRVKVQTEDETTAYSNVVALNNTWTEKVTLQSNVVQSVARINASGEYAYQLFDETGRLLAKGKITNGLNEVPLQTAKQGIVILKIFNQGEQYHFRIIKQ